jgi:dihydrofolate reductase
MAKVVVFNSVSIDGYFTGPDGDLSWAHRADDPEWKEFISGNAKGNARLLFGRVTYEMMVNYWPTPMAAQNDPWSRRG